MDDKLSKGIDLIREWYYDEIRSLAEQAIEACHGKLITAKYAIEELYDVPLAHHKSAMASWQERRMASVEISLTDGTTRTIRYQERMPGNEPREFLTEWVDNATDNHEFTWYTAAVLLASENENAYQDDMREPAPNPEVACCYAMRADVWEYLEARSDEWDFEDPDQDPCDNPDCPKQLDGAAEHVDGACS